MRANLGPSTPSIENVKNENDCLLIQKLNGRFCLNLNIALSNL